MRLCGTCGALMWGENCTNRQCDEFYNTERRVMAKFLGLASAEEYRELLAKEVTESGVDVNA